MIFTLRRWADLTAKATCVFTLAGGLALAGGPVFTGSAGAAESDLPVDAVPLMRPAPLRAQPQLNDEPMPATETTGETPQGAEPAPADGAPSTTAALGAPEPTLARLSFEPDDATLASPARAALQSFADGFKARGGRVALKSYAGAIGDTSSNARRLSLKRALAVREFLLAQGVAADRLEVRALGGVRDTGSPDRVDIVKAGH